MSYAVNFSGKQVKVNLTRAAVRALSKSEKPIQAEMELYFSCLIRKRVVFGEAANHLTGELVAGKLYVQFRPVMTRHCGKNFDGEEPPLTDFPIEDAAPFVPKWLTIDYRRGCGRANSVIKEARVELIGASLNLAQRFPPLRIGGFMF